MLLLLESEVQLMSEDFEARFNWEQQIELEDNLPWIKC